MEWASGVSSTTSSTFRTKDSVASEGADLELTLGHGAVDRGTQPRARGVDVASTRLRGHLLELRAGCEGVGVPLDRGVVLAVLLHAHPGQTVQARDLGEACPGVETLVLQRLLAGRRERDHQTPPPAVGTFSGVSSSAAFLARFSATSARQYSLALVVSTSNSKRSVISGLTSARST